MAKKKTIAEQTADQVEEIEISAPEQDELELINQDEELDDEGDEIVEDEELDETAAAETLKANSKSGGPDPKSKLEVMKAVIGAIASASSTELTKWHEQAQALIGKEARTIPGGAASKNKSSIDAKPSHAVKEDLQQLFGADATLTEDVKDRLETLFEAAVAFRVDLERAKIEEEVQAQAVELAEAVRAELEEQLELYLDHTAQKWMEENTVAIESTLRSEITEEFIGGLRNLFIENNINIPVEQVDVVETMAEKIERLEATVNEQMAQISELKEIKEQATMEQIFDDICEGLTDTQIEKFRTLADGLDFDGNLDVFAKKLAVVKESYFSAPGPKKQQELSETFTEEADGVQTEVKFYDPSIKAYHQLLDRLAPSA